MKISTKSQYGLRAMIHLANCKGRVCCLKEISQKESISFDYLEKIMSKLEKKGLVESKKGVKGGYFLSIPSKKIKLGKIIESLEGKPFLVKCMNNFCPRSKKCSAKRGWKKIYKNLDLALNSVTLADLIKK